MAKQSEKIEALAKYLGCDPSEIVEGYDSDHFEYDNEEYAVYTDEEADEATYNDIENFIDDVGIEGFTQSFQDWIFNFALNDDWFADAQRESAEFYVNDIEDEGSDTYENRLIEELVDNGIIDEEDFHYAEDDELEEHPLLNDDIDLDDAKEELIDSMCEEDPIEWYRWNFGFGRDFTDMLKKGYGPSLDMDAIVKECIEQDGRGHFLGYYDGDEIELDNNLFAYRQN